ncbi:acyl-CoA dehydrogenase [Actinoplanes sp. ATCC 53533]|uniref:acyl-CoA dehydrogenase family protein n=1 Tax=Actinoplanes sp. ATCC 53533 TaxID=1288362 RepID=UPI000F7660C4|nr:acyl-CoA dehydrogenase family protein [Actinoplanes sp. ATCC 53533]RSM55802.1 acyl-CoA dehydrogenase [Actinoplanes sp. ATCC 53533]
MRDVDPTALGETEEQAQLRGVLRDFFAATSGPDDVREHISAPRGFDEALWSRLAGEIGAQGLAIPEEYGGSGFSFAELAVVLEEAGRVLACGPLLSTVVLAGYTLLLSDDRAACHRYLPAIAAGSRTATVAGYDDHSDLTATREAGGWVGDGHADFVLDGAGADVLLLAARTGAGTGLFACEAGAPGLTRRARPVLDGTRPQALVTLRQTPLTPIAARDATAVVARVLDIGRAALAAEQVGGSAHALDATVAYVAQRHQFGRPIGSFQAVKHRLADLLVEIEAARSAAAHAAACVTGTPNKVARPPDAVAGTPNKVAGLPDAVAGSPNEVAGLPGELAVAAGVAQVVCSETYRRAAAEYVQLHGGIGFTWEHPAHLYLRRARSAEVLFGTPDEHRARLGELLGLTS